MHASTTCSSGVASFLFLFLFSLSSINQSPLPVSPRSSNSSLTTFYSLLPLPSPVNRLFSVSTSKIRLLSDCGISGPLSQSPLIPRFLRLGLHIVPSRIFATPRRRLIERRKKRDIKIENPHLAPPAKRKQARNLYSSGFLFNLRPVFPLSLPSSSFLALNNRGIRTRKLFHGPVIA